MLTMRMNLGGIGNQQNNTKMNTTVKERLIARISVDGQTKTIALDVEQQFPDGTVLYVNKEHEVFKFIGNGLQAALKIFKIFTKATTPKEADPFTMMAGIRSAELLDMLNNFTEIEDSKLV